MKRVFLSVHIAWAFCYGLLAILWWERGWEPALATLLVGAAVTALRRWSWPASLHLFILLIGAGLGTATMLNPWAMLVLVALALGTWDIELFARRLGAFSEIDARLWRQHFRILAWVLALGLGTGALALSLKFSFAFGWALLCAVLFVIAFLLLLRAPLKPAQVHQNASPERDH